MIIDAAPLFRPADLTSKDIKRRGLAAFVNFLERKLNASIVQDARDIPYGRADLVEQWQLASLLKDRGVINSLGVHLTTFPDEPTMKTWVAICNNETNHAAGGASPHSDQDALMATLAEALERYIWYTQRNHFKDPIRAREDQMAKAHVPLDRFAGFSDAQKEKSGQRDLRNATLLWVEGTSLLNGKPLHVPAQIVSGSRDTQVTPEPSIRQRTTIGLATWPTRSGARLAGALEIIERDAYMIMWLNQIIPPRVAIEEVASKSESLRTFAARCERYGLKIHVLRMPTDAPAHAICVILEDLRGSPRFAFGLRAHRSLATAVEKAMTEALRARLGYRLHETTDAPWDMRTPVESIGHRDRLYYWGVPEHAKHLEYLLRSAIEPMTPMPWDHDTVEAHLARILEWCKSSGYECLSVPLTHSAKNPTALHIEMVVIPEMQPAYLDESRRTFGGTRLASIPTRLGYQPLPTPFDAHPHPFS